MLKIWISQKLTVYLYQKVKGIDAQPYSMGIINIGGNNYGSNQLRGHQRAWQVHQGANR